MRKIVMVAIFATAVLIAGARNAAQFFAMPEADAADMLLDINARLDMLDYYVAGLDHSSANIMDGKATIVGADSTSLYFRPTEGVDAALYVAVSGADTTLVVVHTYMLPQPDSRVAVFDTQWRPVTALTMPEFSDWLTLSGRNEMSDVVNLLPFVLATARYDADTSTLVFTNTMHQYFVDDDSRAAVARWLMPQLRYALRGKKFKIQK